MQTKYLGTAFVLIGSITLLLGVARLNEPRSVVASDAARESLIAQQVSTEQAGTGSESGKIVDPQFGRHIDQAIDASQFASARWGINVVSLSKGTTLYQRNSTQHFTPASNMKIYTTGVALELLGADYRWRTSVYALSKPDASGTIAGDVVLYGRGAPDLIADTRNGNENSLGKLAETLHAAGVKRIKGNVIGDDSYFRGNVLGEGWQWNDIQWYFGAEASALSVNDNKIDMNVFPATKADALPDVKTSDSQGYVQVENRMAPGSRAPRSTIGLHRGLSDNRVEVWGEFAPGAKGFGVRLSVHNPALWAARIFLTQLKAKGITVEGQANAVSSRSAPSQRFEPSSANEIAFVSSKSLAEIARITNKDSNNLYAELILRTLGRERAPMLLEKEPPGRERGDDEAGTSLLRMWLARNGVSTERMALHDGSGLSRLNLVTPEATTGLLTSLWKSPSNQVFKDSLPIAGKDGTLAGRLKTLGGRVFAKTGSLVYDDALSGYILTNNGETFAFSIYCNDYTGRGSSSRLIDQIVQILAAYPDVPSQSAQKSH